NKLDLDNGNGKKLLLSDNSFKDLEKEPSYKNKINLLEIIEKTALRSNQKSSLEWIWGKSPESDAYFSTKLTFYDDQFSLYPEYRFFIGNDPFRDPKSWFFSLEDYPVKPIETVSYKGQIVNKGRTEFFKDSATIVQTYDDEPVKSECLVTDLNISDIKTEPELPEFDCGSSDEITDFIMDVVFYEKAQDGDIHTTKKTINISDLLKDAFKIDDSIKYIRLTGTDFLFEGNEVKKSNTESVIEIKGDINICRKRLRKYLAEGMIEPNKKRSIELVTGVNKDKLSYNAIIVTVYDGQTSFFPEYKVYASSEDRKDKNSWFNKL
ncbi:MAG: hypothetical protein KKD38_09615, partial [Candidatus Delongbacteria bacterium]|nr:hypothetical protein [Candidatus Delongbacteria bacterium]